MPRTKLWVASMGSTIQRPSPASPTTPNSSPATVWRGNASAMRLRTMRLDAGIGLGDQRAVRLGVDGQLAAEVAERDRIGLVQQLVREAEEGSRAVIGHARRIRADVHGGSGAGGDECPVCVDPGRARWQIAAGESLVDRHVVPGPSARRVKRSSNRCAHRAADPVSSSRSTAATDSSIESTMKPLMPSSITSGTDPDP